MTADQHQPVDPRLEAQTTGWLADGPESLPDHVLQDVLQHTRTTPQTRRRYLGRWLDRDEGTGRRATGRDHPPNTNRRNRRMLSATAIAAAIAIIALSLNALDGQAPAPPGAEGPKSLGVSADGSADYASIQAAVDAAAHGDTIFIRPGTYNESVLVEKDLKIVGAGNGQAVTVRIPDDGPTRSFEGMSLQYGFWFEDASAEIANLAIAGPGAGVSALVAVGGDLFAHGLTEDLDPYLVWPYGFLYMSGDATGTIHGNTSKAFVWIDGTATPTVRENTIHNVIRSDGDSAPHIHDNDIGGVWAYGNAEPWIERNHIDYANNGGADGGFSSCGVDVAGAPRPSVVDNQILNAPTGICAGGGDPVEIRGNSVSDSGQVGIRLSGTDTIVNDNTITGDTAGIALGTGSPTISGNSIEVGGRGISVGARSTATIEGNTVCGADDSIHVAAGAEPTIGENEVC